MTGPLQVMSTLGNRPDDQTFERARRWCAAQFAKRYPDRRYEHASFLASEILKECDTWFALDSFGVEGWATSTETGVEYLNFGDSYHPTVLVRTRRDGVSFHFARGGWAEFASQGEAS